MAKIKALYTGDLRYLWGSKRIPLFTLNSSTLTFVFELDEDICYSLESVLTDRDFVIMMCVDSENDDDKRMHVISKDEFLFDLLYEGKAEIKPKK